ncbi:MAG: hypothetical protein K0Q74_1262 [Gammaproteobacteria bacterium]|nr:hypothetical protein [Gammaproteobacteria bacterium]
MFETIKQQPIEAAVFNNQVTANLFDLAPPDFSVELSGAVISLPKLPSIKEKVFIKSDRSLESVPHKYGLEAYALCNEALREVLNEHVWLPHGQILRDLEAGSLKIFLTAPSHEANTPLYAFYNIAEKTILIFYKPGLRKEDYKQLLLNELMSHLVVRTHERCRIKISGEQIMLRSLNFLKEDGSIDRTLKEKFERSIIEGIARINAIKALWAIRKEGLSPAENHLLIQFLAAAKHYTPLPVHTHLSDLGGIVGFRQMIKAGYFREQGGYFEPGPHYPEKTAFFRGHLQDDYFVVHYTSNMQSARGRIDGFLADFDQMQAAMNFVGDHPRAYAKRGNDEKLHEMGTFIAQFPKPLLELFFPDFRAYIHWYSLRCSSGASKSPPPKVTSSCAIAGAPWFFSPPPVPKQRYSEKMPDKSQPAREYPRAGKC